ncbi:MerR family transcriptional regulator [Sinanaerobacter chloroacetimidivorans]|jgi:DNA-binding transcriptional MerR regulator|uniref:MerR family transcriptional regulator n=1 Tax=Sinanaerobacter chloroacetimidivorans TaxID=2818044 RepID=A0A8J8B301_9FIRM|nr:MerR family transcriptional regulator [Sinanaerobacter chloroacetimidivorans]MBR0600368.1 MerR family transcriptional regulator [Sinanaerobacter chloroacetimidivorans]
MEYSISQAAKKTKLSTFTLRYYDREGLLPSLSRNKSGNRVFTESDMDILSVVCCLKNTGMPIKQIKQFTDWQKEGNHTLTLRNAMLQEHRKEVLQQIADLQNNLRMIDHKLDYYQNACEAYEKGSPIPCCEHKFEDDK